MWLTVVDEIKWNWCLFPQSDDMNSLTKDDLFKLSESVRQSYILFQMHKHSVVSDFYSYIWPQLFDQDIFNDEWF